MKVLHLINSASKGGRELYVKDLIISSQTQHISNYCYCPKYSVIEKCLQNLSIPVIDSQSRSKISLSTLFELKKLISDNQIDIIHSHTNKDVFTGSLLKILTGLPHVYSIYMGVSKKRDLIHDFIYGRVDHLISSSEFSAKQAAEYLAVQKNKISVIRYGRNSSIYKQANRELNSTGEKSRKIVAGMMSRIDPGKGFEILFQAIKMIPVELLNNFEFRIMGEPTLKPVSKNGTPQSEDAASLLYQNLINLSKQPPYDKVIKIYPFNDDFTGFLSELDFFVHPAPDEMYGLAILDAMFSKLPVIGTNAGGTPEQIGNNQRGILITPGNSTELAAALTTYIQNPNKVVADGREAYNWVRLEHDFNVTIPKILEIYKKLV